jgi:site-specific DNA recombinase
MKAIIYCRQSSGDSDFSESVENQKSKCEALAKKEGYEIVGVYQDLNTSGKTYPAGSEDIATMDIAFQTWYKEQSGRKMFRDGFGNVIKHLHKETIDVIIVYDITRLYRPISGSFLESHINQILMANGIKILTVANGVIDLGNFNDSLITALQNRINHEQIAVQRRKSKEALKKLKDNGEYKAGLWKKYGFKPAFNKRGIEIVPREAEMVKTIFDMFVSGYSYTNILHEINSSFHDVLGEVVFNRTILKRIIASPEYCGYVYNSNGELIKSKQTDGFIDFSLWKDANSILNKRKTVNLRPKKNWLPLSGYVLCDKCGSRLISHYTSDRKRKHVTNYYTCEKHTKIKNHTPCKINLANSRMIKQGEGLVEAIYPMLSLAALKELESVNKQDELCKELEKLQVEYTNVIEKEKSLTKMYVDGLIDEETVKSSLKANSEKKQKLNVDILNLEQLISNDGNSVEKQIELLKRIVNQGITQEEYEKLIRKSIKQVLIHDKYVKIQTFFGEITLNRQKLSNFNLLPHYFMNMDKKYNVNLIYYYGLEQQMPFTPDVEKELIGDFGKMKIWYVKNTGYGVTA